MFCIAFFSIIILSLRCLTNIQKRDFLPLSIRTKRSVKKINTNKSIIQRFSRLRQAPWSRDGTVPFATIRASTTVLMCSATLGASTRAKNLSSANSVWRNSLSKKTCEFIFEFTLAREVRANKLLGRTIWQEMSRL